MKIETGTAADVAGTWRGVGVGEEVAAFARAVVAGAGPLVPVRARSLLWAASRLGAWGAGVGLGPEAAVLLAPSTIERFVAVGMVRWSESTRRSARTNLRFLARANGIIRDAEPTPLRRGRAKPPYGPAEVASLFALAAAQPTEDRRQRLVGLLCLGLGAGLQGADLRAVTGNHVLSRSGGVLVVVEGRRARVVPVLARYGEPLLASAAHAGGRFVCGGSRLDRRNLTAPLVADLAGGADLPRLEVGRLRATWLCEQLSRLGLPQLLAAAGVTHSQRVFDLAATLEAGDEATLVATLG